MPLSSHNPSTSTNNANTHLNDVVKAMQAEVAEDWHKVEEVMTSQLTGEEFDKLPLLPEIANHLLTAGGKRIRPLLCLTAEKLLGRSTKPVMNDPVKPIVYLAAAVEFIHGATLFHDDVIDKATKRRGKKTANHVWGNHLPVLVGDFLFARAFQLMVKTQNQAVLTQLAGTAATLSMGEVWQLSHQLHYQENFLTMADYEKIIFAKTGALFSASFIVAGLLQNQDPAEPSNRALHDLGEALGMIFQLVDDGLDYFGNPDIIKKEIGSDFYEGKITLPILLLYTAAKNDRAIIEKLNDYFVVDTSPDTPLSERTPAKTSGDLSWLLQQLQGYNIADMAQHHIEQFVARAMKALDYFSDSPVKNLLKKFTLASHQRQW